MEIKSNKFWDFLPRHLKTESDKGRFTSLDRINEESEWSSLENKSIRIEVPLKKEFMKRHKRTMTLSPTLSDDKDVAVLQRFLIKLKKYQSVYNSFETSAIKQRVLNPSNCKGSLYYYKHIHYSNQDKFFKRQGKRNILSEELRCETSNDYYENFTSPEDTFVYPSITRAKINQFYSSLRNTSDVQEIIEAPKPKRKKTMIKTKKTILNRQNPKLVKIFQDMCGGNNISLKSCRLTNYLFKQYLSRKFKSEMAESFSKFFDFKSANFEDFLTEVDRILFSNDEKLLTICFDAFDFNHDKYICYQDTYSAIHARNDDLYDSDLVKLNTMLDMKKKGIVPLKRCLSRKARRPSVISLTSELTSFEDSARAKEILPVHPSKPEAITFDDFCRIEFKGKPQLVCSLFSYICNYDINLCQDIQSPSALSRRNSEDLIYDQSFLLTKDLQLLNYYKELEDKLRAFGYDESKDLMEKFELLRDKAVLDQRVITKKSMIEMWGKLFGNNNEYVAERFFYVFTDQQYKFITKPMFLGKIYLFINDDGFRKKVAFEFYDARADKKLTSDEVYRMEQSLPEGSLAHKECSM